MCGKRSIGMNEFMTNPYVNFVGWLISIISFIWGLFEHNRANKLKANLRLIEKNIIETDSHENIHIQDKATYVGTNDGTLNINNN